MAIYGAVNQGISVYRAFAVERAQDSVIAAETMKATPQELAVRLKNNNDYLNLANDVLNLILKQVTQLQL